MNKIKVKPNPYTLRTIYLRESRIHIAEGFNPSIPGQKLLGQFRNHGGKATCTTMIPKDGKGDPISTCTFTTRFELRYIQQSEDVIAASESEDGAQLAAEIVADISIEYNIDPSEIPSQADLQLWGSGNALFQTWPYWREYCQSTLSRMNLPITIMPMLNVDKPNQDEAMEADSNIT